MQMDELARSLKAVPGKVIVIVQACGSGAGVFRTRAEENAARAALRNAARAFDRSVIDAFAAADPGIEEGEASNAIDMGPDAPNTGELRVSNKFYVLTASRYQEDSFGVEGRSSFNWFTKWLTDGVGTSGRMPADTNKDGRATLKELFKYIDKQGRGHPIKIDGKVYYQHVQVYPKNSGFVLFRR